MHEGMHCLGNPLSDTAIGMKVNNMKEIRCTHCGSEDVQKASVIFEGGTSRGTSISGGSVGGRGAMMSTVSTSQTTLASKMQPPPRMGIPKMIACVVGMLLTGTLAVGMMPGQEPWWMFWAFLLAMLTFVLVRGIKHNKAYPERIQVYNKTWFCLRCGETSLI